MERGRKKRTKILTVKLYGVERLLEEMTSACHVHASEVVRAGIRMLYKEWLAHGKDCNWIIGVIWKYGMPMPAVEEVDDDG